MKASPSNRSLQLYGNLIILPFRFCQRTLKMNLSLGSSGLDCVGPPPSPGLSPKPQVAVKGTQGQLLGGTHFADQEKATERGLETSRLEPTKSKTKISREVTAIPKQRRGYSNRIVLGHSREPTGLHAPSPSGSSGSSEGIRDAHAAACPLPSRWPLTDGGPGHRPAASQSVLGRTCQPWRPSVSGARAGRPPSPGHKHSSRFL